MRPGAEVTPIISALTYWLKPVTAPPKHEVSRKCKATLCPEGGRTRSTWQAALITTMQVKCYAISRRKSKAELLSFFLSLGKYQPMGRGIFASDYLCFLTNIKK